LNDGLILDGSIKIGSRFHQGSTKVASTVDILKTSTVDATLVLPYTNLGSTMEDWRMEDGKWRMERKQGVR
jgi:hypothetical protein